MSWTDGEWSIPPSGAYAAVAETVAVQSVAQSSGNVVVTLASNWGVNAQSNPYYDPSGAASGEEASFSIDSNGNFVVSAYI